MRKSIAAAAITASALTGGAIGLAVFGPSSVGAQSGATTTTAPSTTTPSTTAPGTPPAPPAPGKGPDGGRHHGMGGRMGGTSAAAKAIGISETDLVTALRSGKTIAAVAKSHGVAASKVVDAVVADTKSKLAAEVKAGRLTQAQADKIQTDLKARVTDMVNGTFPRGDKGGRGFGGPGGGPGFGGPGFGGWRDGVGDASVIAKAIGISESDLTTALRSGKTIAAVAKSHGVAASKVISALVTGDKADLAAAVKAGRLTQAQADKMQTDLQQRATDQVNGTFAGKGRGGRPGMALPHG